MTTITQRRSARFLLVEDDEDHALLIQRALRGTIITNTVDRVADGEEAMAFLRQTGKFAKAERPDIILLDLKLPRKSGHEVLEEIKQDPGLHYIPVVVLTTSRATADLERAYDAYVNSYLVKPLEFGQLDDLIRQVEMYWSGWNEFVDPDRARARLATTKVQTPNTPSVPVTDKN